MTQKMVNEGRLFKKLKYFFERPDRLVVELAQNAQRSGATQLDISVEGQSLIIKDNGGGAASAAPLFILADSAWDDSIEQNENPAGWGLYYLFCLCKTVFIRSIFGSVFVDCKALLEDNGYRANVLQEINPNDRIDIGLEIRATLLEGAAQKIASSLAKPQVDWAYCLEKAEVQLAYFPLKITLNGREIKRKSIENTHSHCKVVAHYMGNKVRLDPYGLKNNMKNICVVWYGIIVQFPSWSAAAIEVTAGSPLTPVLPYRNSMQDDEKLDRFEEFLKEQAVSYCIKRVEGWHKKGCPKDDVEILDDLKTLEALATQEQLDSLPAFYCNVVDYYYADEVDTSKTLVKYEFVTPDSRVESEKAVLYLNGEEKDEDEIEEGTIRLPESTFLQYITPNKAPAWIKNVVAEKKYKLHVDYNPEVSYKAGWFYCWYNAKITCAGKNIPVVGLIRGYDEGDVFYKESPEAFWEISDSVFKTRVFSDDSDSDTYDTQHDAFEDEIRKIIRKLTGHYDFDNLFAGFKDVKEINNIWDIRSIAVGRKHITIKTKKETFEIRIK